MTPCDKFLILILLLLSLSSYILIKNIFSHSVNRTAIIEIAGREAMRISLAPNLPPRQVTLDIEKGKASLEISGGKIRMLPMSDDLCPKHICSRRGWIDNPWEMIVCIPNAISVRIAGEEAKGGIDLITR